MNPGRKQKRSRAYWIALAVYGTYSVLTLSYWTWDWFFHHGMKRFFIGVWWLDAAPAMAIPTFPASLTIGLLLRITSDWLVQWQSEHSFICMIIAWAWFTLVGFIQWFVVIPVLWSKLRRKTVPAA